MKIGLKYSFLFFLILFVISSCGTQQKLSSGDDGKIQIAILQMNDVYEINGVDGGKHGVLSRVAYYYEELQKQYPLTLMVMAGDFLNPSLISTMKYNGNRVKGKQMIEVLNAMELDVAAFGNHEFDLDEEDLQMRINESKFDWIATNIYQNCGDRSYPFYKEVKGKKKFIKEQKLFEFVDADGSTLELGVFSATINSNPVDYVTYLDADSCASIEIELLRESSDVVVGLTHLAIKEDLILAANHPEIDLIMGGHEHDHSYHKVGNVVVAKADANAKTIYIHLIDHDKKTGTTNVKSTLVEMNEEIPKDPEINALIESWKNILDENVKQIIPEPYEVVLQTEEPLDGRESTIRNGPSNMGSLFTSAMLKASKHSAVAAIMNSGSIRIDDQLSGDIEAIDIFRALPYGGEIHEISVTGNLFLGILRYSESAKGTGAYLQYYGLEKKGNIWFAGGVEIKSDSTYVIALNDFLLQGYDIPFLKEDNTGIGRIYKPDRGDLSDNRNDIRKAIIEYMKML